VAAYVVFLVSMRGRRMKEYEDDEGKMCFKMKGDKGIVVD